VLGIADAEHGEATPDAPNLVISKLSCSLVGRTQRVRIVPDTLVYQIYQTEEVTEEYRCNYGLNPRVHGRIRDGRLRVAGIDDDEQVKIIELPDHRFFIATLFLPQLSSRPGVPHPLIGAFLKAGLDFRHIERQSGTGMYNGTVEG
jgi:CTP synthase (UTP-ammonia lyase)